MNLSEHTDAIQRTAMCSVMGRGFFQTEKQQSIYQYISGLNESPPTIVVSAERDNFLRIVNTNVSATKATGFTRAEILSLTVDALWDK